VTELLWLPVPDAGSHQDAAPFDMQRPRRPRGVAPEEEGGLRTEGLDSEPAEGV
jgi:hypothetical protein